MSFNDTGATGVDVRVAENCVDLTRTDSTALLREFDIAAIDPAAAADRVTEYWVNAPKSLILACVHLVAALNAFADESEKLDVFLSRLVTNRVLFENDVLSRLKANGKLAMLRKIAQHAGALLQQKPLCLLPGGYSAIYQVCLLIEEVGLERAILELSTRTDVTRDDVIKVRSALKAAEHKPVSQQATPDIAGAELIGLHLTEQNMRSFEGEYADTRVLDKCLRRPEPADDAGLVAIVPLRSLGPFQQSLMPLLGFGAIHRLFLERAADQPDVTDRDVIVVATRGKAASPVTLAAFPIDLGCQDVLKLAETLFPESKIRCQMFAQARTEGWSTYIDSENWHEKPSLR